MPLGWTLPDESAKAGYEALLTDEGATQGRSCGLLRAKRFARGSGTLMQTFDAKPYRGKRLRFRAQSKATDLPEAAQAQLWLRVERKDGGVGFFDNMVDRPIDSSDWKGYEIVGDVDIDAQTISIGLLIILGGRAWIDDVSLETIPGVNVSNEPPRVITDRGLENLIALARLYGCVRYFHPSDEVANTNWSQFAIDAVRRAEPARDAARLATRLQEIFRPVAPTVRVFRRGRPKPLLQDLHQLSHRGPLKIVTWLHTGYGNYNLTRLYTSERVSSELINGRIPEGFTDPALPYQLELTVDVLAAVPMALYADEKGTLPHAQRPIHQDRQSILRIPASTSRDRATRLATVIIAWNILQHFYPYFDEVKGDWEGILPRSLSAAAREDDGVAFLTTLKRMLFELHDAHAIVTHPSQPPAYRPPMSWDWIEEHLVVTRVDATDTDVQVGDVVNRIDGVLTAEALELAGQRNSAATPRYLRYLAMREVLEGAKDSEIILEIEKPNGSAFAKRTRRTVPLAQSPTGPRADNIREVGGSTGSIYYVDLRRVSDNEFNDALSKLSGAKGVIFDLRGYPRVSPDFLSHVIDRPVVSPQFLLPTVIRPNRERLDFRLDQQWTIEPKPQRIGGHRVFLTDKRAVSQAETDMGIVEYYKLGTIVGEPTAGTNGDLNLVLLPGGYRLSWTGLKVLKQDGSQHHGIGIWPGILVTRTIKGIREGRDEVLEAGIREIEHSLEKSASLPR